VGTLSVTLQRKGALKNMAFVGISIREVSATEGIDFVAVHEEITSIRLYTPCNSRSRLRKGVYHLIEVISNEPSEVSATEGSDFVASTARQVQFNPGIVYY
jgi:hypothetical protein